MDDDRRSGVPSRRAPAGRLGEVLVAGHIAGGSGLAVGAVRRHPTWGLTFVTAGTGRYRDATRDEAVRPGTLVVVHPGHPHWYGADRGGWDEVFVVFDGVAFELARHRGALSVDRPLVHDLPVARWHHRFAAFGRRSRPSTPEARDAEAVDLLAALLEATAAVARSSRGGDRLGWLERSLHLLEHDLGESLDLRAVAAEVDMPYETWRRRFRAQTGTSPYAHRAARRLDAATDLLVHTGLGVRDIAAATGFSDERHLVRRFRERTGVTPRAFRNLDR
ncbi:helix-turn-helix domain-containing protein [Humibacillus xanthopallidus]|uniref:AraC-like DNA-binding protein n=1 Tax=Humibacillus xanthopallidus TaxID=412689 RepID=A0A543HVY0_9MICO|nr:AraC family transcriptional regulator [Humibacillus xanthopallidus]TQM62470.1 AraC-like DNA-binding protein [Humibacillus xanthopallidus]